VVRASGCASWSPFLARLTGRRSWVDPGLAGGMSLLAWERLGTPQEELESVAEERDVWVSHLNLLPEE